MKNQYSFFMISLVLAYAPAIMAGSFVLSGVVPDRGFALTRESTSTKIELQERSELKIFFKEMKASRGPASLDSGPVSSSENWKKLTEAKNFTASSYVRVEAP